MVVSCRMRPCGVVSTERPRRHRRPPARSARSRRLVPRFAISSLKLLIRKRCSARFLHRLCRMAPCSTRRSAPSGGGTRRVRLDRVGNVIAERRGRAPFPVWWSARIWILFSPRHGCARASGRHHAAGARHQRRLPGAGRAGRRRPRHQAGRDKTAGSLTFVGTVGEEGWAIFAGSAGFWSRDEGEGESVRLHRWRGHEYRVARCGEPAVPHHDERAGRPQLRQLRDGQSDSRPRPRYRWHRENASATWCQGDVQRRTDWRRHLD